RPAGAPATDQTAGRPGTEERDSAGGVRIAQADATWRTTVVVQAEGAVDAPATNRDGQGRPGGAVIARDYDQHAVLALVRASRPQPGWAWERFTREGPLALLPIRHGDDAQDTYSLVWCCAPAHAQALVALDDAAFGRALTAAFGDRLGELTSVSARQVYPLRLRWRREPVQGRCVAIGNAAQTLHPVAGQGLNLGLRDAEQLAQALRAWLHRPATDPTPLLAAFGRARRADRTVTAGITDLLPRVFASGSPLVEHACGLTLLALDTIPALRRPLARQLMQGLRS
ncbi:FAD-dependent monooxygenase, partial [Achromobacter sp. GG226]|uniref:FAD-dependent monooxygenase n=1 Tax=Verticiella alkaliphila TaxID=2779529 RepID=UPI001C0E88F7